MGSSYEPGSTIKALVMAAGIEEGVVTPDSTMDEQGPVRVGEYAIRTWNNEYHGRITMTQILERSSNVGMVFVGEKLGKINFSNTFMILVLVNQAELTSKMKAALSCVSLLIGQISILLLHRLVRASL